MNKECGKSWQLLKPHTDTHTFAYKREQHTN